MVRLFFKKLILVITINFHLVIFLTLKKHSLWKDSLILKKSQFSLDEQRKKEIELALHAEGAIKRQL